MILAFRGSLDPRPDLRPSAGGPDVPVDTSDGDGDSGGRDDWVTLGTFWSSVEAHLARLKLEAEGIDCLILDDHMANHQLFALATGGVKLMVPAAEAEHARAILRLSGSLDPASWQDQVGDDGSDAARDGPRWWAWPLVPVLLSPTLLLGPAGLVLFLMGVAVGFAYLASRP